MKKVDDIADVLHEMLLRTNYLLNEMEHEGTDTEEVTILIHQVARIYKHICTKTIRGSPNRIH